MLIVGLQQMNAKWFMFSSPLIDAIMNGLIAKIIEMTPLELSRSMTAMSKMGFRWDSFPELLKRRIVHSATKALNSKVEPGQLSNIIHAFGGMGLRLSALEKKSPTFIKAFEKSLATISQSGDASEVAGMILGMGFMESSWYDLSDRDRKYVIDGLTRVFSSSSNMPGLHTINEPFMFKHKKLGNPTSNNQVYEMNSKEEVVLTTQLIANAMYGLSMMIFDCTNSTRINELLPVHITLCEALSKFNFMEVSLQEKEQILAYLNIVNTVLHLKIDSSFADHLEESFLSSPFLFVQPNIENRQDPKTVSKLQQSVVSSISRELKIRNDELKVRKEYSSFCGAFPVDAVVLEGDQPVAFVEVDGPQHFVEGQLRRKDLMKETLYRKKHPCATFTRVNFDQVDHLGAKYVGREVANYITLVMHICDHEEEVMQEISNRSFKISRPSSGPYPIGGQHHACNHHVYGYSTASTLPSYYHVESWVARRAKIQLNRALDWQFVEQHRNHLVQSFLSDYAYADTEEDNS
jgi:hypothetical protein